ncbi:MAG: hypothetical protein NXI30_20760 [bacterium]|nr:hypothetical protein [bacterium]
MAQLFVPSTIEDGSQDWSVLPLPVNLYRLSSSSSKSRLDSRPKRLVESLTIDAVESVDAERIASDGALLIRYGESPRESKASTPAVASGGWAILWEPGNRISINGVATATGVAILRNRDEIALDGGSRLYFSTERLAAVETYVDADSPRCPRCTLPIERGERYVRCPGCSVLHHQESDRECFTYSSTCALCDQPTSLDTGFRWSPEGL